MNSIDLIKFLSNYYGISSKDLKIKTLTHFDIKELFPYIQRASYGYVDNHMNEVYKGEIILVYDANNVIVPYINPHLHIDYLPNTYCNVDDSFYDITSLDLNMLSKDELLKIRKILKKYHQIKDERCVVDAIRNTKNKKVMRYKRERELLKGDVRND